MAIRYSKKAGSFTLTTKNTCYIMQLYGGEQLVHLYYGEKKRGMQMPEYKARYKSFSPYFERFGMNYSPDTALSEYSFWGSGDFRTTALRIKNISGTSCTRFVYKSHKVLPGRPEFATNLPYARADEDTQTLMITLEDAAYGCLVRMYYTVYPDCDIISRYITVENNSKSPVKIEKIMSLCLDMPDAKGWQSAVLPGAHYWERFAFQRSPLFRGSQCFSSRRGASSHQMNPFLCLCTDKTTEDRGEAYGFNLVYSGNFLNEIEVDQNNTVRVQMGLGSENFAMTVDPGKSFTTPEAVMTYSAHGFGDMSRNMHRFIRRYISPAEKFPVRPVVVNTWEASFFDIDEEKLLEFARVAPECGVDMLVMDDGWFGQRHHDRAGLGDWFENRDKFPDGLAAFVKKVKANGIRFGIWVEPEMVNPDSDLFRAHPEWCLRCPDRESTHSRHQLVLDMGNPAVLDYLKASFAKTFDGCGIDYFKWDMNRHLAEVGSSVLPADRQDEAAWHYMMGVYDLYAWFGEHFPEAIIENCSGGGGRYDMAMMRYSTQIWTSDNTWPQHRVKIQYGSSYAYPASVMSCHISNPHNACADPELMNYRFCTALAGPMGYEMHLPHASEEIRAVIREQVKFYRSVEHIILQGDLYRQISPFETPYSAYYYVTEDRSEILATFLDQCNGPAKTLKLKYRAADPEAVYADAVTGEEFTGRQLRAGIEIQTFGHADRGWVKHLVKKS